MSILVTKLKAIVSSLKKRGIDDIVIVNVLKEYLQYTVLNFIYNNSEYSSLVMYGGSLLRICYELPRMSEDLDFQSAAEIELDDLKAKLVTYFKKDFNLDVEIKVIKRNHTKNMTNTLALKFDFLKELKVNVGWTKLKLRIDINIFPEAGDFATEVISPDPKDNYAFSVKTYHISTLMASKIAAVLQREERNIEGEASACKPRDIFDLIWYMRLKVIPDLAYLRAKGIKMENHLELFDELAKKVLQLEDRAFDKDLAKLFYNRAEFEDWYKNWRNLFVNLKNSYDIYRVKELEWIDYGTDISTEIKDIHYRFSTESDARAVWFTFRLTREFLNFIRISSENRVPKIESKINTKTIGRVKQPNERELEYIGLFYKKIINYLKRNDYIVIQKKITTKVIRSEGSNLDVSRQIFLDKGLLERARLEDLL
ncbi:nucleotidyl transferase AbiEii/AbiGii toxin family protein [Patescibacteria group bacterium]|nr:nucleotidyl transferase AbiEii/AbiGii toxin family protein [Patescibacteria group bacterium]